MAILTERQRAFVIAMLETGGRSPKRAGILAGLKYANENSLAVQAFDLAHDPRVQSAMVEVARERMNANAIMAVSTLIEMANGDIVGTTPKDRLKAIEMLLNRTGLHALTEHKVEVTHVASDDEAVAKLKRLANVLGLDPAKLLGSVGAKISDKGEIVDAEFEEVLDFSEFAAE